MLDYIINADLILKIIILAIINMILGTIWYSKFAFGPMWIKAIGKTEKEFKEMSKGAGKSYMMSLINSLITIFILGEILLLINATTIIDGIIIAFMVWIGFLVLGSLSNIMFENRSIKSFMIYGIYQLIIYIITGIFFTTLPALI
jgi:hypothetical protein